MTSSSTWLVLSWMLLLVQLHTTSIDASSMHPLPKFSHGTNYKEFETNLKPHQNELSHVTPLSSLKKRLAILLTNRQVQDQKLMKHQCQTRFMFQMPLKHNLYQYMFGKADEADQTHNYLQLQFNHDQVGITRPKPRLVQNVSLKKTTWWPNSQDEQDLCGDEIETCFSKQGEWNVKCFRKRMGQGHALYESLKDHILHWEFEHSEKGRNGIVNVSNQHRYCTIHSSPGENEQEQEWNSYRPHTKLITFAEFQWKLPRLPFLKDAKVPHVIQNVGKKLWKPPSMFVMNPVAVVYDLIDESTHDGDLFSSSAYATMKGHLLSGEERVTVILRNDANSQYPATSTVATTATSLHFASNGVTSDGGPYVDVEICSYSKAAPSLLGKLVWPFIGRKQDNFFKCEMEALQKMTQQNLEE
ncbi:hypothetical protein CTEN210_01318 [Chaetoceros tenuissimus]|uniref:START domain-containing protein n=1 Tax=Chaetoceros tenuissimus TaxID=426638 RepID=A0AAD3CFT1_9STRA|nr:hypothetical protein CTEN210_01318 [Chaetoceros tenuissimus]